MYANIQKKRRTLTFLNQICPRIDWGFEIQKTNAGIRINIVGIPCVAIFRQNWQLWLLRPKFLQKLIFGSEFQKSMCRFKISTSKKPCVSILSENGQLRNFRPKPNYTQFFGSNIVEGVGWGKAEMSWVEVGCMV